ncbi:hypothetical protein VTN00DRAFT_270 [Thermoascus crustaceus]|uniref:uncharacterized protein n=1 Tax=Thermoascus crustaceus TaxID=5088 RepID=UPI0037427B72
MAGALGLHMVSNLDVGRPQGGQRILATDRPAAASQPPNPRLPREPSGLVRLSLTLICALKQLANSPRLLFWAASNSGACPCPASPPSSPALSFVFSFSSRALNKILPELLSL